MAASVASAAAWKSGVMYLLDTICRGTVAGGLGSPAGGMPSVARGEGEEDVAAPVVEAAAHPTEPDARALRQPVALR